MSVRVNCTSFFGTWIQVHTWLVKYCQFLVTICQQVVRYAPTLSQDSPAEERQTGESGMEL